ncbi:Plant stearoyl-acyl-carrier-protein desaturase family protein [Hibiscus syriacus]|uniref:Plant stearoyl-acyl-carrier-protein desaturase family protein n=1 Tax=Hibiscus syriacus TaxID=106335 RepID=A0A6A2WU00_HIBSY|nr:Plant stearoyl-acyl-carrier-protein desaturase family protein [Hibiscus syriacus]
MEISRNPSKLSVSPASSMGLIVGPREAVKTGGQLLTLNGNHEIMNIEGDFRYVTEKGLEEFDVWAYCVRARIAALRPNGPISRRFLANNSTVLVVGDSVFVHGGLLAKHVDYGLQRINEEVRDWINGSKGGRAPEYCRGRNAVVWLRKFSDELEKNCDCSLLEHVLATIPGAKRMIMGHTIQVAGINGVCDSRAIRIDVECRKAAVMDCLKFWRLIRTRG